MRLIFLAVASLALVACGNSDDTDNTTPEAPRETSGETSTPETAWIRTG